MLAILRLGRGGGGDASSLMPVLGPAAALAALASPRNAGGVVMDGVVELTAARTGAVERKRTPMGIARGMLRASSAELRRTGNDMVAVVA